MSRSKALVSGLVAFGLAVAPMAADAECYTAKEWPAFNVKVMLGILENAALECGQVVGHNHDKDYNGLIGRTSGQIMADGSVMRSHFKRLYGRGWEDRLDGFTTLVVNKASLHSMGSMTFCADSDILFQDVAEANSANLEQVAMAFNQAHFSELSDLGVACPATRIQTASRKTHHHHHAKKVASAG